MPARGLRAVKSRQGGDIGQDCTHEADPDPVLSQEQIAQADDSHGYSIDHIDHGEGRWLVLEADTF